MQAHSLFQNALLYKGRSRLSAVTWPYDKYPEMPELDRGKKITLIDADGPGVITQIHSSTYFDKAVPFNIEHEDVSARGLVVRLWYDGEEKPSIEMPWMDFLGDIQCSSPFYDTVFFSKVKYSHNFRLEMPFKKHIRIEIKNTSNIDLIGYIDLQYDTLPSLPDNCGYLYVDYRSGRSRVPHDLIEVFNVDGGGSIAAHWLQIESDIPGCANGEALCEANNEIFIDGEERPSMEYLGTEDYYGYSWGFKELQSDGFAAIIKNDALPNGGARIGMLRCRTSDKIRYQQSCRIMMDYTEEKFSEIKTDQTVFPLNENGLPKLTFTADYISCYYYYALKE
jgi:Protein of unknown function (DUF2961)